MKNTKSGYTEKVVTNCYQDVVEELANHIKDKSNLGSKTHIELSERLKTLSTLMTANK